MNLKELLREIPYKWRVQSFSKNSPKAQCVAYIDARDVMDLLDEVCGPHGWQDAYKAEGSMLFAGIGIKIGDEWVWKWDTGSESNIEKEKGHSSDAFKRAAVKWGIGRFLYSLKIHTVNSNEKKTKDNFPYVVDHEGKRVWDVTQYINDLKGNDPKPKKEPEPKNSAEEPKLLTCDELIKKLNEATAFPHLDNIGKKYALDFSKLTDKEQKEVRIAKDAKKAEIATFMKKGEQ